MVARFEENIKVLSKQEDVVVVKLNEIISESRQTDNKDGGTGNVVVTILRWSLFPECDRFFHSH
ncbi:hypothetical protein PN471_11225 [Aphanizomenon sp. CS-733/32]|nr:hypothetical protein [Aphanizomenon sp. CS-733/32]